MGLLDQSEIGSFERDGFLILRGFFDVTEVTELRDATSRILRSAKRGMRGVGFDPWTTAAGDALNPKRVYYYNDIFLRHPRLDAHMRNPRLATVFCELYDNDIDAFQSATVVKPAMMNFDFQGWHQDAPDYIPLSNYKLSSALTYLGDMGPDTGGTSLVPGSHRDGLFERGYVEMPGWPVRKRIIVGFEKYEPRIVTPQFHPGDLLIFHPCVMHRANSNYTETSKIGLINAYRSVDCIDIEQRSTFKADNIPITRDREVVPP
ncbi:MAG: phytanoyl-CoA dioxygenase family protein [Gammaproteobacteria bacterium]|nr:phytanoyl-CoA dioxygenase family protein [Gammaproteobacteria bacterium]MYF29569.1 phytanoyl-CoA dioxygenase family protein [Gammaproteobacteria bacterium]MYK44859.1 phytanoyl-CoA dioxygenase family protein [Gammaproteobacteria bacterium]